MKLIISVMKIVDNVLPLLESFINWNIIYTGTGYYYTDDRNPNRGKSYR